MLRVSAVSLLASGAAALQLQATPVHTSKASIAMGLEVGDKMPANVLRQTGTANKNAVIFFYGADDAPSCSKELSAFEKNLDEFKARSATVVGVRNSKGAKGFDGSFSLVEDEDDELRNEIGIAKDFGILGGRETYVVDKSGTIQGVHNNQFDPNSHVTTSLTALGPVQKQFDLFDYKVVAGLFGINLY